MVRQTPPFHVCVHVVLAPPSVLGAWSMALGLWLPFEYYYYYYYYPNAGKMQIGIVYRSRSVPQAVFNIVLTRLLRHVSMCHTPCVILGDFNEDCLHKQSSAVVSLMSSFNFRQLVTIPTTDQGTLIDHVYTNQICEPSDISVVVHVKDTYYSDHNTIYCCIPVIDFH